MRPLDAALREQPSHTVTMTVFLYFVDEFKQRIQTFLLFLYDWHFPSFSFNYIFIVQRQEECRWQFKPIRASVHTAHSILLERGSRALSLYAMSIFQFHLIRPHFYIFFYLCRQIKKGRSIFNLQGKQQLKFIINQQIYSYLTMLSKLTTGSPLTGPHQASVWDNPALNFSAQASAPDSGKFSSAASHGFLNDLRQKSTVSHPKVGAVATTTGMLAAFGYFQIKSTTTAGGLVLSTGTASALVDGAAVSWKAPVNTADEFWYVDGSLQLQSVYGWGLSYSATGNPIIIGTFLQAKDTANAVFPDTANAGGTILSGPAVLDVDGGAPVAWSTAYHFVLGTTSGATNTDALGTGNGAQGLCSQSSAKTGVRAVLPAPAATPNDNYCLSIAAAGPATFTATRTSQAVDLLLVPASTITNLTPAVVSPVAAAFDACFNPTTRQLAVGSGGTGFAATATATIDTSLDTKWAGSRTGTTRVLTQPQALAGLAWADLFTWGDASCAAKIIAGPAMASCYYKVTGGTAQAPTYTYRQMLLLPDLPDTSYIKNTITLPVPAAAAGKLVFGDDFCIVCALAARNGNWNNGIGNTGSSAGGNQDLGLYTWTSATFAFMTLSANKEACYSGFRSTAPVAGTVVRVASTIPPLPYWYQYERLAAPRSATGKSISADWLATVTSGAWASTCLKADWACALYQFPAGHTSTTATTASPCGFTPNTDSTFKKTIGGALYTPVAYVADATPATATANAIMTCASSGCTLTVSNAKTVRVDDSVCVVCTVDGVGLYSSLTYLALQALGPADVLATAGVADVTPSKLIVAGVTDTLVLGAVGVAPRRASSSGLIKYGPFFAAGTALVTDGADATGTWGRYACTAPCAAPTATTLTASANTFDSFFWAYDLPAGATALSAATAKTIYTTCTLKAASAGTLSTATCSSGTAYTDSDTAGGTPYLAISTTTVTSRQVAAGYTTLACVVCTGINPITSLAFTAFTPALPTITITSNVAQYSQRSACSSAIPGSVMAPLLAANAALPTAISPSAQYLINFSAARDSQQAAPTITDASLGSPVSPSDATLYFSSAATGTKALLFMPQQSAAATALGTALWPTTGVPAGSYNSCVLGSCTLQSVTTGGAIDKTTTFAATGVTYTPEALLAGVGLSLDTAAGNPLNVMLDRTVPGGWGGLFQYQCTYADTGAAPETETIIFQIGQEPNCPAQWPQAATRGVPIAGTTKWSSVTQESASLVADSPVWGGIIYQVPVSYVGSTNGFGTGTPTSFGYADFFVAPASPPALSTYFPNPTGATPAGPCGFTSCSLYLPAANGSCKLAAAPITIPAQQTLGVPSPGLPTSTSAAPVTYTAWENYIGDQTNPAAPNLSMAAATPWAISASTSNPLGYSHTVCYACSFGYNALSPTLGRMTAKITVTAQQVCGAVVSVNAAAVVNVAYVKSTTPVWKQVTASGWLDYFTNGQGGLSGSAANQAAATGTDCMAIPENFGTDLAPNWRTCQLVATTGSGATLACSPGPTAYAGANLWWGTAAGIAPNGAQGDIDQLWARQAVTAQVATTLYGWQESVCVRCLLADGTTRVNSSPLTVSQDSLCKTSLSVKPSLSPYQSVVYSAQRAQVLVTTNGWNDFFVNSETGCPIASCTMLASDCTTAWPASANYSMAAGSPWAISAQVNVAAGYSDVMCIQCTSGVTASGFQTVQVLYAWNLAPAQAAVLPTPVAPMPPVIDPSIPADDCADSLVLSLTPTDALPLSYDGWFGTVQTVTSKGWADFFVNSLPDRCPITSCDLLSVGCADAFVAANRQIAIDNNGNVRAHRDYPWGYTQALCVECSNGSQVAQADGYSVSVTAMGFTDFLLQTFSFYNYVACGLVTSAYPSKDLLGPSPWAYCY